MALFDAQALIIQRIKQSVAGLVTVGNPSVLVGLQDIGPLLPACIVMPGAGGVSAHQKHGPGAMEDQAWEIVLLVSHQAPGAGDGVTESLAGGFLSQIFTALSGWLPSAGFPRPMVYAGRDDPVYGRGYAEFPMRFTVMAKI